MITVDILDEKPSGDVQVVSHGQIPVPSKIAMQKKHVAPKIGNLI
jgi:hypothetical protein